jgi:hypothetical protein
MTMLRAIYGGGVLLLVFFLSVTYATGSRDSEGAYVYQATPSVQFVYSHTPCSLYSLDTYYHDVRLVEGYALDLADMKYAHGCVALYRDQRTGIPLAEFRVRFIDREGAEASLEHSFRQSLFTQRSAM